MTGARDFVGVGVPFAAGVAAGILLLPFFPGPITPSLAILLTGAVLFLFLHSGDRLSFHAAQSAIGGIFFLTGIFCGANGAWIGTALPGNEGFPARIATEACQELRMVIDKIPYTSEDVRGLVKALLIGDRSGLNREITDVFRTSGAAHLLALSGLHLGILYLMLLWITAPLGNSRVSRIVRFLLIVSASGFYSLLTGAGPSIVRAFLFILLNEACKLAGREREPQRVLLAGLTIQLALKPGVIASVGFQLSYLAMTGIYLLYPMLESLYPASGNRRLDRWNPLRRIWRGASLTISCQLFTAPVAWFHFRTFPQYFLLTNLIAMPLTSVIMMLSVLTISLSAIGCCPAWLVALDEQAVTLLLGCLRIISGM